MEVDEDAPTILCNFFVNSRTRRNIGFQTLRTVNCRNGFGQAQRACAHEGREGTTEYGQPRRKRKREKEAEEGSGETISTAAETDDSLQACAADIASARKILVLKLKTAAETGPRRPLQMLRGAGRVFKFPN